MQNFGKNVFKMQQNRSGLHLLGHMMRGLYSGPDGINGDRNL